MPIAVLCSALNECLLAPYGLAKAHSTGNCRSFAINIAVSVSLVLPQSLRPLQISADYQGGSVLCCSPPRLLCCPVQTGDTASTIPTPVTA